MDKNPSTESPRSSGVLSAIHLESRHELPFPREAIWPVLSKTDWLNRSIGLPPVTYQIDKRDEGGSEIKASTRLFGQQLKWRELPFEWIEPEYYLVRRIFEGGPFREAKMGMKLEEKNGKTEIVAYSDLVPRSVFGRLVGLRLLGPKTDRDMKKVVAHLTEFLEGRKTVALPQLPIHPPNESALQAGLKKLRDTGQPADLVQRLETFLRESPDLDLSHIRPLAVARQWGRDQWDVLRLFLHTPVCGLLDLRWEILCPNCRASGQGSSASLSNLKRGAHCDVCQIQFDAEFDKSVELKFSVNPAVRPVESQTFCLAGPGTKPHILSQLPLEPREESEWKLPRGNGPLRLRSPQIKEPRDIDAEMLAPDGKGFLIECETGGFVVRSSPGAGIRIHNPNPFPILVSIEQTSWNDDILTAARITNWQDFRDLFANEVISPTEQVTVGSQVVLFTDLRGSTAMYHGMGDPKAYALVRNHFSILVEAVRAHHGTVVKTIGDAVMAAFYRVDEALAAVKQMHVNLSATKNNLSAPLALKSSLHVGPCLVVNANDKLDLFGTSINLAARMVDCCKGGDLTVSNELFLRPETAEFVRALPTPPEKSEIKFRGFDTPQAVWRIQII